MTGLITFSLCRNDTSWPRTADNRCPLHSARVGTPALQSANIDNTQRLESIDQKKLAALEKLKKSLLYQAFSGAL